jgi:hypothetical protein
LAFSLFSPVNKLNITSSNGQKEDVERTIKYFINDGIVLRFNKVGFNPPEIIGQHFFNPLQESS